MTKDTPITPSVSAIIITLSFIIKPYISQWVTKIKQII